MLVQLRQCCQSPLLGLELRTAATAKHGAALLDNATYIPRPQGEDIAGDQARIPMTDAVHFPALGKSGPHDSPYGSVHAGGITAAGQYGNTFHVFLPVIILSRFFEISTLLHRLQRPPVLTSVFFHNIGKSLHEVVYSFLPLFQELVAEHRKVSATRKFFDSQLSKSSM
jgi:hypothetical protein